MRMLLLSAACGLLIGCQSEESLRLAHEIGAIQELKAISAAEVQYYSQKGHYSGDFHELGISAPDPANGYTYRMALAQGGFEIRAMPVEFGKTGSRSFFSDQTMVIRQSKTSDPANADSPVIE